MPTLTLTDFLLARIEDDEACVTILACECGEGVSEVDPLPSCPDRVLAECQVKRMLVEEHSPPALYCAWTHGANDKHEDDYPCPTLCILATAYAAHPDYRDDWRVSPG